MTWYSIKSLVGADVSKPEQEQVRRASSAPIPSSLFRKQESKAVGGGGGRYRASGGRRKQKRERAFDLQRR
eukprot:CAMPEP_0183300984 /NCGR_PEP_ID=MMETSP0160_2-20130417/7226_1 /TAXON_ID=2839 ORGANISM="Odontella Sinensis, Strain Grunow 1884" /NCGR_SAMPLE_ID=MMETSP0160_2 /ASSEMBLY_ACC=CAM_ASM_000250 /LENGTH=70 /DNA_ID=CAMNT_0025463495 /DNA_START=652 /DNA_END=860 /DNA_ORIENTATION=-